MQPASCTNLSFHSSSDNSIAPIVVPAHGISSLGTEDEEFLWMPSSTTLRSDAFVTARSFDDQGVTPLSPPQNNSLWSSPKLSRPERQLPFSQSPQSSRHSSLPPPLFSSETKAAIPPQGPHAVPPLFTSAQPSMEQLRTHLTEPAPLHPDGRRNTAVFESGGSTSVLTRQATTNTQDNANFVSQPSSLSIPLLAQTGQMKRQTTVFSVNSHKEAAVHPAQMTPLSHSDPPSPSGLHSPPHAPVRGLLPIMVPVAPSFRNASSTNTGDSNEPSSVPRYVNNDLTFTAQHAALRNCQSPDVQTGDASRSAAAAPAVAGGSSGNPPAPTNNGCSSSVPAEKKDDGGWWSRFSKAFLNHKARVDDYLQTVVDPMADPYGNQRRQEARERGQSLGTGATTQSTGGSSGFNGLFNDSEHDGPIHGYQVFNGQPYGAGSRDPYNIARGPGGLGAGGSTVSGDSSAVARRHLSANRNAVLSERIVIDPTHEPFHPHLAPMIRPADHYPEDIYEDDGIATDVDDEQPTIEVDLISALRSYRRNPNDCYGHLVAAALSTRSKENPVTGEELREADHNPFLVRLVIESGCLDEKDPVAQTQVQETLDRLMDVRPMLYEYLVSFFQLPFIRLSHEQYTLLKHSGLEYIDLMNQFSHILPDSETYSVLANYSSKMYAMNVTCLVIGLASSVFTTVTIVLVLARWMTENMDYQSFGFYTLIVYGCGYALNLIAIIFITRTKQNEAPYAPADKLHTPSPYVNVVPALPIYDVLCLITCIRAMRRRNLIITHNVLACSRISCICYSVLFGMPQLITQSYFNHTSDDIAPYLQGQWQYEMLKIAVIIQWSISLLRFIWMMTAYESTSRMGFARFSISSQSTWHDRNCGIIHTLHYLTVYLLESNVYLIIAAAIIRSRVQSVCDFLPIVVMSLCGVSVVLIFAVYFVLVFTEVSVIGLSYVSIPSVLLQVAVFVVSVINYSDQCYVFDQRILKGGFIFGYITWCAYAVAFVIWVVLMFLKLAHRTCGVGILARVIPTCTSGSGKGKAKSVSIEGLGTHSSSSSSSSSSSALPVALPPLSADEAGQGTRNESM